MAQRLEVTDDSEYATDEDVDRAVHALTEAQLLKLRDVAALRGRGLTRVGLGLGSEDLLHEAIVRTMTGDRRWRKVKVTFENHLMATMRSIAGHARDEGCREPLAVETCDDGNEQRARMPDPERTLAARLAIEQIERAFDGDDEVLLVLDDLAKGMTGPEIREHLGIDQQQYETIIIRLRRGVHGMKGWAP